VAKLPDASEIKPSIGMSGRPIATYDTTGYARGAAAMAQGAKDIGTGLTQAGNQVSAVNVRNDALAKQEKEKDDILDTAQAQAKWGVNKTNWLNSAKDDQDHETLGARSLENLTAIGEDAANHIRDPRRRELFRAAIADDIARSQAGINDLVQKRRADAWGAGLISTLEGVRQGALLAETPEEKRERIDDANRLIDAGAAKGFVSKEWAAQSKKKWVEDYTIAEFEKLPAEQRLMALRGGAPMQDAMKYFVGKGYEPHKAAGIVANLIAESGRSLNPNAVNKGDGRDGSDSIGIGQWNGPRAIALKQFAAAQGKPWNDLGVQLDFVDHELRGTEAKAGAMLNAARTPEEAARAMLHYERPKDYERGHAYRLSSAKQVHDLFSKGGGSAGVGFLPEDKRVKLERQAETQVLQEKTYESRQRGEALEKQFIDAGVGRADLPKRDEIENDPTLMPQERNALLVKYDKATADAATFRQTYDWFANPDTQFNRTEKDHRNGVDSMYKFFGGGAGDPDADRKAAEQVVARSAMVPTATVANLRGALVSDDPRRVQAALDDGLRLMTRSDDIFTGQPDGKDVEAAVTDYRRRLGSMGKDEATNVYLNGRKVPFAQKEAINKELNKKIEKIEIGDISSAFDNSWMPLNDPKVGFGEKEKAGLLGDYREMVRDELEFPGRTLDDAKAAALGKLKKSWGVTEVNGTKTVTRFAPEAHPALANIPTAQRSELIAQQAVEAIQEETGFLETGIKIDRKDIVLIPIPGHTDTAFKNSEPAPYMLMWRDPKTNLWNSLPWGFDRQAAFVFDHKRAERDASMAREVATQRGQAAAVANVPFTQSLDPVAAQTAQPSDGGAVAPAPPREILPGVGTEAIPGGFVVPETNVGTKRQRYRTGNSFTSGAKPMVLED
jgi:hypothetical protein